MFTASMCVAQSEEECAIPHSRVVCVCVCVCARARDCVVARSCFEGRGGGGDHTAAIVERSLLTYAPADLSFQT
jgi:hypothetical protein